MKTDKINFINALYAEQIDKIKFSRMYEDVIIPSKKPDDAGFDIYARVTEDYLVIEPHETVLIPTGLRVWVPKGYYMQLFERGSTGTKGIGQRAGVIDSSYTGEILVPITNHSNGFLVLANRDVTKEEINPNGIWEPYTVYPLSKAITQGVILPVPEFDVEEITEEEMLARKTDRGEGRLGSSNK
jgi:dUTP pyrophosphatase